MIIIRPIDSNNTQKYKVDTSVESLQQCFTYLLTKYHIDIDITAFSIEIEKVTLEQH